MTHAPHSDSPASDFVFAAKLADLAIDAVLAVELRGTPLVLVRDADGVRALDGKCPHAGAPLEKGALCGKKLVCPWHMAAFDTTDGARLEPPALAGLRVYPVELRGEEIFVDPAGGRAATEPTSGDAAAGPVVFIGGGAVTSAAITALRERDAARRVVVVEPRASEPIDRTQLTKNALAGKMPPEKLALFSPETAKKLDFTRIEDRATGIDPAARRVRLASGEDVAYGDCVIAVGGAPVAADFPGAKLGGVGTLRERADLERLRPSLQAGKQAVVLGTSFIGMEAASALRDAGLEVTVVGRETDAPFTKLFGEAVARAILRLHEERGVRFLLGDEVVAAEGAERVERVRLRSGKELACDVLIVGFGVKPATEFLKNTAGLDLREDGGVAVDGTLRAAPHVYAGGDVAYAPTAAGDVRIEHWRTAQQHGDAIGRRLAGEDPGPFAEAPFFWSQQHGKRLAYVGHAKTWDEIVVDGDLAALECIVYYLADGKVAAALACKRERATAVLVEALARPLTLDAARRAVQNA